MESYFILCANSEEWDIIQIPKDEEMLNLVKAIVEEIDDKSVMFISSGKLEYSTIISEGENLIHEFLSVIEDIDDNENLMLNLRKLSELLGIDLIINRED